MLSSAKVTHRAPRKRVADASVQRVRPVFGEADDVGRRLDTRQLAEVPRNPGAGQHDAQPRGHAPVEAVREQVEGEGPGRKEERPDPDRPVVQPIADLVAWCEWRGRCRARPARRVPASAPGWAASAGRARRAARRDPQSSFVTRPSSVVRVRPSSESLLLSGQRRDGRRQLEGLRVNRVEAHRE